MTWLNEQSETETVLVTIKRNNKRSGYILEGEHFDCFAWNSDPMLQQLLTAMVAWADAGQGKQLLIRKETAEKRGFVVVPKLEKKQPVMVHYRLTETGYTTTTSEVADGPNPFL